MFTLACPLVGLLLTGMLVGCNPKGKEASGEVIYTNPLPVAFGDPFILSASDGYYYMYGTGGVEKGFGAYRSDNLVDWEFVGQVYSGNQPRSWTVKNYWAPEVYEVDGKYLMFFSADWKVNPTDELENFRIGVAVADEPTGPFIEVRMSRCLTRVTRLSMRISCNTTENVPLLLPLLLQEPGGERGGRVGKGAGPFRGDRGELGVWC